MNTLKNGSLVAGVFAALAASLCCVIPVLAFIGGVSGLATSFSWTEPYRPYFIGATILIFGFAWYQKLKQRKQLDCHCETLEKSSFWQTKKYLGIITVLSALFIAFPYYAKIFYSVPRQIVIVPRQKMEIHTVEIKISGMDCEGCTRHIDGELSKVQGVFEIKTSFKNATAIVRYDRNKVSVDSIENTVKNIGYKVVSTNNLK
jgi:mercuric ion transport protein